MLAIFDQDDRLLDMKALFDALPLGLILLDRTVSIRMVNTAASTILASRAELRVHGPMIRVRRREEGLGLADAVRRVFRTGDTGSFAFLGHTGLPELVLDLRLVRSVDLVVAIIQADQPAMARPNTPMQATVAMMEGGDVPLPDIPESLSFTLSPLSAETLPDERP